MAEQPTRLAAKPGIKRDSTRFDNEHYIDGRWCRFQRGLPKKMGGYQQVTDTVPEITRGITSFSEQDIQYLHLGHPNTVGQYLVSNGTLNSFNDRTPAGFATDLNNLWQFDIFADTLGTGNHLLIAHAAPNAREIDNAVGGEIYVGTVTDSAILDQVGLNAAWNTGSNRPVSGGVVVSGQYIWAFGSRGLILQSQINDLSGAPVEINIGTQKIICAKPLRGSGAGPAALFWSLDQVIRASFIPQGPPDFAYDILASKGSILSSQSVVEYDGIYYWPTVDRFVLFNGVVREIPNDMNLDFFFDNLNFVQRNKVFGFKVPRYGEIWWCYPRGSATECTHAIIYNVRGQFWYDTPLPDNDDTNQGRTAGIYADVFRRPFMVDNDTNTTSGGRTLWQHETATDKIRLSNVDAIESFFETGELSMLDQGQTNSLRVARVEPDFNQIGNLTIQVKGRANANTDVVDGPTKTIFASPSSPDEETVKFKEIRRLMSFRVVSNQTGGFYELGKTFIHIEPADGRIES